MSDIFERIMESFRDNQPPVTSRPCNDCPWRKQSLPGWLGPMAAEDWVALAMSDQPVACHMTLDEDFSWEGAFQCAGAADFRANICKLPRDPDVARGAPNDAVFSSPAEFVAYHKVGSA